MTLAMLARIWLFGGWPGVVVTLWLYGSVVTWFLVVAIGALRGEVQGPDESSGVPSYPPGE